MGLKLQVLKNQKPKTITVEVIKETIQASESESLESSESGSSEKVPKIKVPELQKPKKIVKTRPYMSQR